MFLHKNKHKSTTCVVDLVAQTHHLVIGCPDHHHSWLVIYKVGPTVVQRVGEKVVKIGSVKQKQK